MSDQTNLEIDFGWVLDGIEKYIDDNPDDFLQHYGVPGMKWGKRKAKSDRPELKGLGPDKITRITKYGEEITLSKDRPTAIHKMMGRMSKKYREEYDKGAFLSIRDSNGKKVGDAIIEKKNADELYLNWLGIDKSARGKGYASAVMKAAEEFGRQENFKKMTLEVPGNSPDARHIYEKLGFKYIGEVDGGNKDPLWGGLANMEYIFDTAKHHDVDDFLVHYGIPGMKWGKRGAKSGSSNSKPKMSRKKKIAIGIGVGAAVAIGTAVTLKVVSKNSKRPISDIMDSPSVKRGQQTKTNQPTSKPSSSSNSSSKPKPPSPYPMTPLIATPILDEIIKKYNL